MKFSVAEAVEVLSAIEPPSMFLFDEAKTTDDIERIASEESLWMIEPITILFGELPHNPGLPPEDYFGKLHNAGRRTEQKALNEWLAAHGSDIRISVDDEA